MVWSMTQSRGFENNKHEYNINEKFFILFLNEYLICEYTDK